MFVVIKKIKLPKDWKVMIKDGKINKKCVITNKYAFCYIGTYSIYYLLKILYRYNLLQIVNKIGTKNFL